MGHTMTLNIPETVYRFLIRKAAEAGQEPESVAVQLLSTATQPTDDPLEAFIGAFSSQAPDWADQHDAHLGATFDKKMR